MKLDIVAGLHELRAIVNAAQVRIPIHSSIRIHPFWEFDAGMLQSMDVLFCAPILLFAGALCSAGGIGGGGIYVTVLMVAGHLSPHDAVPLSKAIVFLGSLSSLVLNLKKMATTQSNGRQSSSLIDWGICRIVVPAALMGTLLGVLLNHLAADWIIVLSLCLTLGLVLVTVLHTAVRQYQEEDRNMKLDVLQDGESPDDALPSSTIGDDEKQPLFAGKKRIKGVLGKNDVPLACATLFLVILCGVFRAHASACAGELQSRAAGHHHVHHACRHPIMSLFFRGTFEGWMTKPSMAEMLQVTFLAVPIFACLALMMYNSRFCVEKEGWAWSQVALYQSMAVTTGCLAGLVGIGGGLIFSPFFLVLGVEPHVAVATSSTCVIFTSSSTTMQYLFTDRIITSLALVYGIVNLVASWAGTTFVHFLQDNFQTRKSYITMIVAVGVFISAVLSVAKLVPMAHWVTQKA